MNIKKMTNAQLKEKVEGMLEAIISGYEEESAAEIILQDRNSLENIKNDVEEGTSFALAVRQELQRVVEAQEDKYYETDMDSFSDDEYNAYSRYGTMYFISRF